MTALAEQLAKAGIDPDIAHLNAEVSRLWSKHGGSFNKTFTALALLLVGDKSALAGACKIIINHSINHSLRGLGGIKIQTFGAPQGSGHEALESRKTNAAAPLHKPPSEAARRAALQAGQVIALSVMDTYRLSDGTPIGDVNFASLPRLKNRSKREAALLDMISKYCVPDDPFTKVRDAVPVKELQRMIQRSAEEADAK